MNRLLLAVSLALFPAAWILIHFAFVNPSWCFSDFCIPGSFNGIMEQVLALFYLFLFATGALAVAAMRVPHIKRFFSNRVAVGWTLTVGEVSWLATTLFLACIVVPAMLWNVRWQAAIARGFLKSNTQTHLVFAILLSVSGDAIAFLLGLVLLPVGKHSFLASGFGLPYTSLYRVHIGLAWTIFVLALVHFGCYILENVWEVNNGWQVVYHNIFVVQQVKYGQRTIYLTMGFVSLSILAFVVATALPYVRRKYFNVFYFSHFLVLAFIAGVLIHINIGVFFIIPGIVLYSIDGIIRLQSRFNKDSVQSVDITKSGYIIVTCSSSKAYHAKPGQFMRVNFPAVSLAEFHPWTVVKSDGKCVTFMFAAGEKTNEWSYKVADKLRDCEMDATFEKVAVILQGPFGREIQICAGKKLDLAVFYVGGTGLAASVAAIERIIAKSLVTRVKLCWSARTTSLADISIIKKWISSGQVSVDLHETIVGDLHDKMVEFSEPQAAVVVAPGKGAKPLSRNDPFKFEEVTLSESEYLHVVNHRPKMSELLKRVAVPMMNCTEENFRLGVFVCGPQQFTLDALKDADLFVRSHSRVMMDIEYECFAL